MTTAIPSVRANARASHLLKIVLAFACIYLVWGSSYLATKVAVDSLPPLLLSGSRCLAAGGLMFAFWVVPSKRLPAKRDWWRATLSALIFIVGGSAGLTVAQQSLSTGLVALLASTTPLFVGLISWMDPRLKTPGVLSCIGLVLGIVAMAFLIGPSNIHPSAANLIGIGSVLFSCLCFGAGTVYAGRLLQGGGIATAMQLCMGGLILLANSFVMGEMRDVHLEHISVVVVSSFAYLTLFVTMAGYSAYNWLMQTVSAEKLSTYAYVNPVVAIGLGWIVLAEPISMGVMYAVCTILGAVALTTFGESLERKFVATFVAPKLSFSFLTLRSHHQRWHR